LFSEQPRKDFLLLHYDYYFLNETEKLRRSELKKKTLLEKEPSCNRKKNAFFFPKTIKVKNRVEKQHRFH